jgi:hypothetical protein
MSKLPDEAFRDTIATIDEKGIENSFFPKNHLVNFMNTESGSAIFYLSF